MKSKSFLVPAAVIAIAAAAAFTALLFQQNADVAPVPAPLVISPTPTQTAPPTPTVYALPALYRVGPGHAHTLISDVADLLKPGDIVELTADISDSFTLTRSGTHDRPIIIRGATRVENGRIVRPRITLSNPRTYGISCLGDWNILEGLDITGASSPAWEAGTAIFYKCDNLVIRNCCIHHNRIGILGNDEENGNILVEFCEFDSNGSTSGNSLMHSLYLRSTTPNAVATVQFCYIHDGVGGNLLKSRYPRNVIRYNWFESPFYSALALSNKMYSLSRQAALLDDGIHPMHSDIVANVFFMGWSPGPRWATTQLGGESESAPGTEGDFNFAHNLFITTNGNPAFPEESGVHLRVKGNVNAVRAWNNVFLEYGCPRSTVYRPGTNWDTPRTTAFVAKRGHGDTIVTGSHNWISTKAVGIPAELKNSARSRNPRFQNLANRNFRPEKASPLAAAGLAPLPKGRVIDLAPEFEPQRGIPANLKPVSRRKASPPSIGPFETPHS